MTSPRDETTRPRWIRVVVGLVLLIALVLAIMFMAQSDDPQGAVIVRIATGLENPRGVAQLPDGRLLVVQAGNGIDAEDPTLETGSLNILDDMNQDGDYDDDGEVHPIFSRVASYNTLTEFGTGHDEVGGLGDVVVLDDGRIFLTRDDPSVGYAPDGSPRGINVVEISPDLAIVGNLIARNATLNSLVYDELTESFFVAESGANRVISVDMAGTATVVAVLPTLEQGQQPVPSGLAIDPVTGDVLVVLFSGQFGDDSQDVISFEPGASRIVRIDRTTGAQSDAVTGLTTAVDLVVDENGNIIVVELTSGPSPPRMPRDFDLFNPDAAPDPGGYGRFAGSVTLYPVGGGEPVVLATGLDSPTNVTLIDGALYVSVGQGTPGRPINGPGGTSRIVGEIYRISDFLP